MRRPNATNAMACYADRPIPRFSPAHCTRLPATQEQCGGEARADQRGQTGWLHPMRVRRPAGAGTSRAAGRAPEQENR